MCKADKANAAEESEESEGGQESNFNGASTHWFGKDGATLD